MRGAHGQIARDTGANAVSVEQDVKVADVLAQLPDGVAVQGNLDPALLLGGGEGLDRAVLEIVSSVPRDRHIFNLGHGIVPQTPIENVSRMIELIRKHDGAAA